MKCLLSFFLIFICSFAIAQQDSSRQQQDSVLHSNVTIDLIRVQRLLAESVADSLKKADLEKQVASLSIQDRQKKGLLLKELTALKTTDSLRRVQQLHQVDSLRRFVKGYPVNPFGKTLFNIYTRLGSFTPQDRAEAVNNRIKKLYGMYDFNTDSLKVNPAEQTSDIVYKDNLIISLTDQDALWANTLKEALAVKLKATMAAAITAYKKETSWQTLSKQILLALAVIISAALIIFAVSRFFKWLLAKIVTQDSWYSKGIKIRNYQLVDAGQQFKILSVVFKAVKWIILLLIVFFTFPILFGIFPFTKNISITLLGYIVTPLKNIGRSVWNYVPSLITIAIIIFIFRYVLKFFGFIRSEIADERLKIPSFYPDWANPTYQILRVFILAFMLIIIFPYLPGSDSGVFKGVSVFVGVLVTFGSAGALGNIVAGLVLTYMRAFKIGDRVKIGDSTGDIIAKTLLVTRIRTIQNEVISIPNSTIMNNHTLNYSANANEAGLIVHTSVTIGYDSPWRQIHQLLIDAALSTPLIEKEPKPYVLQLSLDDYYVSYRINAFTKQPNKQIVIYSDLHANIQDEFNKAGVEIMSPHYKSLRDGNAVSIPPEYLPKDYTAPVFRTQNSEDK